MTLSMYSERTAYHIARFTPDYNRTSLLQLSPCCATGPRTWPPAQDLSLPLGGTLSSLRCPFAWACSPCALTLKHHVCLMTLCIRCLYAEIVFLSVIIHLPCEGYKIGSNSIDLFVCFRQLPLEPLDFPCHLYL